MPKTLVSKICFLYYRSALPYTPQYRVVHLDLKGAAPSISYLKEIFPLISKAGANALLVEYEDMFPYWGEIVNASALNAFTVNQIQELLSVAKTNKLEVIPLGSTDFLAMLHRILTQKLMKLK